MPRMTGARSVRYFSLLAKPVIPAPKNSDNSHPKARWTERKIRTDFATAGVQRSADLRLRSSPLTCPNQ
jgi:hypothetical protein